MIDETTDMEQAWEDSLTEEQAREAAAGNLAPKGKWEGQIEKLTIEVQKTSEKAEAEGRVHPLAGKRIARAQVRLYTEEGEKVIFVDFCPVLVKATSKKGGTYTPSPCENAGYLYSATKLYGRPFPEVLAFAQENRLVYDIGVKKATDEYKASNTVRGISAVSQG